MSESFRIPKLKLLPSKEYPGADQIENPVRYYRWPIFGTLFRRRVELCLVECSGGERVLEVGFGSGVTFLNLKDSYIEIHGLDLLAPVEEVTALFKEKQVETHLLQGDVVNMPYPDDYFDTVLLISILEEIQPEQQLPAFQEIRRVLKPGGQVVYGVPVERPLMVFMFGVLATLSRSRSDIRHHHHTTEKEVFAAANKVLKKVKLIQMKGIPAFVGPVYEVGHFVKTG